MISCIHFLCLFLWILFGSANLIRLVMQNDISSMNVIAMTVGASGFIWLQWVMP